jgi:hypothetical protein
MNGKLLLDEKDPSAAAMIAEWEEGGQYELTTIVTMGAVVDGMREFTVDEIADYGDLVVEEPVEEPAMDPAEMEGAAPAGIPPAVRKAVKAQV